MKIYVPMVLAVLIVVSAWGRAVVPAALPPAVHADTETVTNVPFATALDVAGRLSFGLVCRATPSNNVEVAFGRDSDGNGMLDVGEEDCIVGWDCGVWFVREGADGEALTVVPGKCDELLTVQEMAGFQMILCKCCDTCAQYLAAPANAPYWTTR